MSSQDMQDTKEMIIQAPDLGVEQAQVIEVLVQVGDIIAKNDELMLVESEKASVEVPSSEAGEVVDILVNTGDNITEGANLVKIKVVGDPNQPDSKTERKAEHQTERKTDLGAKQTQVNELPASVGDTTTTSAITKNPSKDNEPNQASAKDVGAKAVYAGPAVRKLCRELGVDITKVQGSAKNGRIIKDDVHAFVKARMESNNIQVAPNPQATGLPPLPDMSGEVWGATHAEGLSNLQKVSIPQLTYNTLIPQVTQFDLADITETENYRQSIKVELKKHGVSLTIVAFIIKAVAHALKQYPKFNSHLSDDHTHLIMRDEVHLGIAVATDAGLIVPVLRHADQKGLKQIATELGELAQKARNKRLGKKDLEGAGFSVSSQGNLGGTYFTPLVNVPQVAILGISEAAIQPRWSAQKSVFEPRLMLPLSLSYDHRVINGADAAIFTRYLAELLQDVRKLLL